MKHTKIFSTLLLLGLLSILAGGCKTAPKAPDPNFLGDFPAQSLGALHLNVVKRFTNDLLPRDVSFVFDPRTNVVKFHHKMMGDNIWVYLTKENRAEMRTAIEQYLADFKAQKLTAEGAKKKGAFGKSSVLMTWGLVGSAHTAYADLRYDYQFITPQRPYFILAAATEKASDGANSPALRIAISPAQCKDVLTVLDDVLLLKLVEELKAEYERFDDVSDGKQSVEAIEQTPEGSNTPAAPAAEPFDDF